MISDCESALPIAQTVSGDQPYFKGFSDKNGRIESPSPHPENSNVNDIKEITSNHIFNYNNECGTIKHSKTEKQEPTVDRFCENNNNNSPSCVEEKYDKVISNQRSYNNIDAKAGASTDKPTTVECTENDSLGNRINNNVNSLATENEVSDKDSMGQSVSNCNSNSPGGVNVNTVPFRNSQQQTIKKQNNRQVGSGDNISTSNHIVCTVSMSHHGNEETERFDDCVIVVDGDTNRPDIKKETEKVNVPSNKKETERVNNPHVKKETERVNNPEVNKDPEKVINPETKKETERVTNSQIKKEAENVNNPEVKKDPEKVIKPETKKETESVNHPDVRKKTDSVCNLDVRKETETVNDSEVRQETERVKNPDVRKVPEIVNSANTTLESERVNRTGLRIELEGVKSTDVRKETGGTNSSNVRKETGSVNSSEIKKKIERFNSLDVRKESEMVNSPEFEKKTARVNSTDARKEREEQENVAESEGCVVVDTKAMGTQQTARRPAENTKKKYVAESHIREDDDVERSWECDSAVDTNNSKQSHNGTGARQYRDSSTECCDGKKVFADSHGYSQLQDVGDVMANHGNSINSLQETNHSSQDGSVDEKNEDSVKVIGATKGENKTNIDTEDNNSDESRQDTAGNVDDNVCADEDSVAGSGICFYKSKCLLRSPETMNKKDKVKVDESEPSWNEEAPFERRDVIVKKDRWVTDLYAVDSLLGRGKFGEVKRCRERRTGRQLAAKFIEVSGPQDRTDVINEVEIMKHLQHPRLLQLYDAFEHRDRFCLVLELVSGGELFERVINDDFILTEKACVMFMRQICDGVAFMHTENILHLDMKPENILCLTREGNRIKIIDFGLARKYNPKDDLRVLFGTPEFVAPEVVNFDPICPATDMWSVGVICYVLLSGLSPFMGEMEAETLSNVTMARWDFNAEEFENISAEAKDFIYKLLVKDPRKRISAAQCLDHQWLRRSVKRESRLPERSLSKKRLRKFVYRRKWQKAINAMLALRRMGVSLC